MLGELLVVTLLVMLGQCVGHSCDLARRLHVHHSRPRHIAVDSVLKIQQILCNTHEINISYTLATCTYKLACVTIQNA